MMGGDILVESELGKGSRFTVVLPVQVPELDEEAPAATGPEAELQDRSRPSEKPLVLVVDDDRTVQEVVARYLQREGFDIALSSGGREGLRLARELNPDAMTLDIQMPDLDGWTVLATIKGDASLAHIPVVLMTIVDERGKGFSLGAADYLVKPVDREALIRVLRRVGITNGRRVLVVDDDEFHRRAVRTVMEQAGWEIHEADNGHAALGQLDRVRPDAVLLDLVMPEMNGFEFLEAMRGEERWRDIPVIIVTARDLTAEDRDRLNGGVERVVLKKGRDEMLREVRDVLDRCIQRRTEKAATA
jgi:CheY-like chemotaxis protein